MHQRHSAGCYAVTVARPDGLGPRDKLVARYESRHRSRNSAETDKHSLVISVIELANSTPNSLGLVSGYHGSGKPHIDWLREHLCDSCTNAARLMHRAALVLGESERMRKRRPPCFMSQYGSSRDLPAHHGAGACRMRIHRHRAALCSQLVSNPAGGWMEIARASPCVRGRGPGCELEPRVSRQHTQAAALRIDCTWRLAVLQEIHCEPMITRPGGLAALPVGET
jgi:hypothetical protein